MKRKLLLVAIMVAALMCLFAMAVSAVEIPEWTDITVVDGMPDKSVFGADGTIEKLAKKYGVEGTAIKDFADQK